MNKKGKTFSKFVETYDAIKASTVSEELPLMNVDMIYIGERGGTLFHNGIQNAVKFTTKNMPSFKGDGIRIGLQYYPIDQKAVLDIATLGGLKGEGLSDSCWERSALISKRIAYNNDAYQFLLKDGVVIGIKKNIAKCPSIKDVVEILPSKDVHLGKGSTGKIVRDWLITDDFYKVSVEYACLGAEEDMMPYCVVQDSDTGESSLTITFGILFSKDNKTGFLPITSASKSYRHNKVIDTPTIYQDVQFFLIDEFVAMKNKILDMKTYDAEEIELSSEFTKNLNKKKVKNISTEGDTLYDQIVSLTISAAAEAEDLGIKQQNAIMNSLYEKVILPHII